MPHDDQLVRRKAASDGLDESDPGKEIEGGFPHVPLAAPDPAQHSRRDEMNPGSENIGEHRPGCEHLGAISVEDEEQLPIAYLGIQ
ncbi:hypothetical protein [Bradyrhizobium sp. SBR1B]|uniref:hypothetical protein n=1 Tax=Bradyrhizobium sp. SBR1B TaxID=2663836 RepID=UPI001792638D|nr:hypothetical protein [Bradyrhizobium sp. SBR1B]MBB4376216.1 hypothetical protein [Bradyrhizobium sp. SBR1B]